MSFKSNCSSLQHCLANSTDFIKSTTSTSSRPRSVSTIRIVSLALISSCPGCSMNIGILFSINCSCTFGIFCAGLSIGSSFSSLIGSPRFLADVSSVIASKFSHSHSLLISLERFLFSFVMTSNFWFNWCRRSWFASSNIESYFGLASSTSTLLAVIIVNLLVDSEEDWDVKLGALFLYFTNVSVLGSIDFFQWDDRGPFLEFAVTNRLEVFSWRMIDEYPGRIAKNVT